MTEETEYGMWGMYGENLNRKIIYPICIITFTLLFIQTAVASPFSNPPALEGTSTILSVLTTDSDQVFPKIFQNQILWIDCTGEFNTIHVFDISSCIEQVIETEFPPVDWAPADLFSDSIVWTTKIGSDYGIVLYNTSTMETVMLSGGNGSRATTPRIYQNHVVWQEALDNYNIYVEDFTTGEITLLTPDTDTTDETNPVIFGSYVAWQSLNTDYSTSDIYLLNLDTGNITSVTPQTLETSEENPQIFDNYIVYQGSDPTNSTFDIYIYDILSGQTQLLTAGTGPTNEVFPFIYDGQIVWIGENPEDSDSCYIYYYTQNTSTYNRLIPDDIGYNYWYPSLFGNHIVWQQTDLVENTYDVALMTIGIEIPSLVASFEAENISGSIPREVFFTDTSTGDPETWLWDFGDGTISINQSPVHLYTTSGNFDVSLIISNSYRRAGTRITNLIQAGSPPVASFEFDRYEGVCPLLVKFSGKTSGTTDFYYWDFGDDSFSEEMNPEHEYKIPGLYSVTLITGNQFGNNTITKPDCITVLNGTTFNLSLKIPGITTINQNAGQQIFINSNILNTNITNQRVLEISPSNLTVQKIILKSVEGFYRDNSSVWNGTINGVEVDSIQFANGIFCFNLQSQEYEENLTVSGAIWNGATQPDLNKFTTIAIAGNQSDPNWSNTVYAEVKEVAYTAQFDQQNLTTQMNATLIFGVSSDWVKTYGWGDNRTLDVRSVPEGAKVYIDTVFFGLTPINVSELTPGSHEVTLIGKGYHPYNMTMVVADERDSIHVIRIGDDGSGEVLNTTFIGHDPVRNLDFFRAESPNGLSTFGLASLSRSGNIFQIAQLVAAEIVPPRSGGGGSGSGGSWVSESTATQSTTSIPTPGPTPAGTSAESQKSAGPVLTASPGVTMEHGEPASQAPVEEEGRPSLGSLTMGTSTLIILKNLSIIFVVIFVTVVFYLRWKRKEE